MDHSPFWAVVTGVLAAIVMGEDEITSTQMGPENGTEIQTSHLIQKLLNGMDPRVRPHAGGDPVKICVDFHVTTLGSIDEMKMEYTIDIYLRQRWHDDRLIYSEPFKSLTLNAQGITQVWVPDIFFPNEKSASFHDITVPNKLLKIFPNGDVMYSLSNIGQLLPNGLELFSDGYTKMFDKNGEFYDESEMILEWKDDRPIELNPELELPEMELIQSKTMACQTKYSTGAFSCLQASFLLERHYGFFVLQTFIPSVLIVVLSWVSFWISPDAVPARISLGVTTVLTMTTQLSGSKVSIPKVSYPKAIDVWMSVCMMFVFTALVEFAFVNALSRKPKGDDPKEEASETTEKEASGGLITRLNPRRMMRKARAADQTLDQLSRVVFPLLFIIFNIVYWSVYLSKGSLDLA